MWLRRCRTLLSLRWHWDGTLDRQPLPVAQIAGCRQAQLADFQGGGRGLSCAACAGADQGPIQAKTKTKAGGVIQPKHPKARLSAASRTCEWAQIDAMNAIDPNVNGPTKLLMVIMTTPRRSPRFLRGWVPLGALDKTSLLEPDWFAAAFVFRAARLRLRSRSDAFDRRTLSIFRFSVIQSPSFLQARLAGI
jgi:hypothetical protein